MSELKLFRVFENSDTAEVASQFLSFWPVASKPPGWTQSAGDDDDDNDNDDVDDDIYIMMKCVFVCDCLKHHVENV